MKYAPTRFNNAVMTDLAHQDDAADRAHLNDLEARLRFLELIHERPDMSGYRSTIEFSIQHLQGLRAAELSKIPAQQEAPCRTQKDQKNRSTFPALPTSYGSHSRLTV